MAIDIKKQATDLAKKAKHYLKPTLYTIVGLLLLYVIIYMKIYKYINKKTFTGIYIV